MVVGYKVEIFRQGQLIYAQDHLLSNHANAKEMAQCDINWHKSICDPASHTYVLEVLTGGPYEGDGSQHCDGLLEVSPYNVD